MLIIKNREKVDAKILFPTINDFISHIKQNKKYINYDSEKIINKINEIYDLLINSTETVRLLRLSRWYGNKLNFRNCTLLSYTFWLDRGWSPIEAKELHDKHVLLFLKPKIKIIKSINFDGNLINFKYKSVFFKLKTHPICSICNSQLILEPKKDYYNIKNCENINCSSHKMRKTEKYLAYLPKDIANEKLKELYKIHQYSSRYCIGYWTTRGFTSEEAKIEISKLQKINDSKLKKRFIKSKENLKKLGYSDEEISNMTTSIFQKEHWKKKGYTNEESIKIISDIQKTNSEKSLIKRKETPELFSAITNTQIGYWIKKGYSKDEAKIKISERQRTFSLEKCILKYGKEDGIKKFTERQEKWTDSLNKNGNLKMGYSKISQELFFRILEFYPIKERENIFFATKNQEFRLNNPNGGLILYDFADLKNKKIIEFHGDNFHGNPLKYQSHDNPNPFKKNITAEHIWEKDNFKLKIANENNFKILVIWDSEYRWGNKDEIINKCLKFLFE